MKNTFLLIFFIVAFTNNLSAQNPLVKQWDKRFGGANEDYLYSLQQTNDGGYILGGYSWSVISGDKTQTSWGLSDYWIVKIDSLGIKQWDKRFGGTNEDALNSMQQTTDGGYILGGYSNSGISGDKTQPVWGGLTYADYWIVKIDSLGIKQWDKRFGGANSDFLYSLQQTTDGGYILGGYSYSGISGDKTQPSWGTMDYWIVKVDSLGIKQWDKRFGGTDDDLLLRLKLTNDGGYILGGYSLSGISGDKTQPSWGGADFWIVKIDSLGIKQWDKRFGGISDDIFSSLLQTTDGGYILEGSTISGIGGDKTQPSWGDADYWIVKIDSLGIKQWDKRFGGIYGDEGVGNISQTSDGGYLLPGTSYSNISGDKTENNLGTEQTWVLKTDSIGNKQWDKTLHTNPTFDDEIGLAIKTKDGCYAMANFTYAGIGGDKTQASQGNNDFWIIKFCDTTSAIVPTINLASSDTSFCEKQCINFTDLSTNSPTSWQWFFPGADTATSTLQNPTNICYSSYGSFDVTLIACNAGGCDTLVLHNFINEYPNPTDSIYQSNDTLYSLPALSYQWYEVTGGIIPGATGQYYVPSLSQPAGYFCVVSDSIGCVATSNIILLTAVPPLSFGEGQGVRLSPNPFESNITISFPKINFKHAAIIIRDMIGTTVFQLAIRNWQSTIDLSFLSKGIYMIEVVADDTRFVRKIIKD